MWICFIRTLLVGNRLNTFRCGINQTIIIKTYFHDSISIRNKLGGK